MSRTRQKGNEFLWLFKMQTSDSSGIISNSLNPVGVGFQATKLGEKLQNERDVLGNIRQSGTVIIYSTISDLEFAIGDGVASKQYAEPIDMSTIVSLKSKEVYGRGNKHNRKTVKLWTIEIS